MLDFLRPRSRAVPAAPEPEARPEAPSLLDRIGDLGEDVLGTGTAVLDAAWDGIRGLFGHREAAADPTPAWAAPLPEEAAPVEKPPPTYPGADGATADKYAYFAHLLEEQGHGDALPTEDGKKMLLALRGLTPDTLASLEASNDPNAFNDMFVALGKDETGAPFVSEYRGSVDPGTPGTHQLQPGRYDYAYEGQKFTSLNGYTVDGAYARMTKDSAKSFDVVHDENKDNVYDPEVDPVQTETNNRAYLMHYGGPNPDGKVGGWSIGCQVIPGVDGDGVKNVDRLLDDLGRDEAFTEVLLDGAALGKPPATS